MKKILALILAFTMVFALAACGEKPQQPEAAEVKKKRKFWRSFLQKRKKQSLRLRF